MPPRGRKKATASAKSKSETSRSKSTPPESNSSTSTSNSDVSASSSSAPISNPIPSVSGTAPSTSRSIPSTSGIASSSAISTPSTSKSTPSRSRNTPSRSRATPSTSRSTPSTSKVTSTPPTTKSTASTSKSPRSKAKPTRSKPTCPTSKSSRFTLKPTASTSKSVSSKLASTPSTSKPKPKRKPKKKKPKPPPPRSVSFMRLLQGRELGLGYAHRFPEIAFDLKVGDYRRVRSHRFGNNDEVLHTAYFLRPGKNALIGAWYIQMRNMFTTAVGQLHYDLSKVNSGRTGYVVSRNTIVDACQLQVNPDCFVCVTSHVNKYTGELHVATPGSRESNEYTTYKYSHPYNRPFWCCNSNFFTERFAVGCDREICVYSVTGIQEIRSIRDNVYSLAYNDNGTVLHMGCETGEFVLYDLRTCQNNARVKVDQQLLDDVLMLNNENYCIVSGVSGCLCQIDLRMQSVVVKYPQHNRRSRRIPVSVNERYGLLSSSGADDVTRIWCLKTGKFLHSFQPPSTYPARSCFVPGSLRGNIHLIQDNYIHVYCMLRK